MTGDTTPISDEAPSGLKLMTTAMTRLVAAVEAELSPTGQPGLAQIKNDAARLFNEGQALALSTAPLLVSAEAERPVCVRCGGRDDLMDRAMMPGSTYCRWCREVFTWRDDAAVVEGLRAELAEMTRQRDAWRFDASKAEDRTDALSERVRDRDAALAALRAAGDAQ